MSSAMVTCSGTYLNLLPHLFLKHLFPKLQPARHIGYCFGNMDGAKKAAPETSAVTSRTLTTLMGPSHTDPGLVAVRTQSGCMVSRMTTVRHPTIIVEACLVCRNLLTWCMTSGSLDFSSSLSKNVGSMSSMALFVCFRDMETVLFEKFEWTLHQLWECVVGMNFHCTGAPMGVDSTPNNVVVIRASGLYYHPSFEPQLNRRGLWTIKFDGTKALWDVAFKVDPKAVALPYDEEDGLWSGDFCTVEKTEADELSDWTAKLDQPMPELPDVIECTNGQLRCPVKKGCAIY